MNASIARAVDFGCNYALVGVFAVGLLGAWTIPTDAPRAGGPAGRQEPVAAPMTILPGTFTSMTVPVVESMAIHVPFAVEPPPVERAAALSSGMELAIVDLPMALLTPFDPTITEDEPARVDSETNIAEVRPLHGRLSHAAGPLRRQVTPMQVADTNEMAQVFQAHDYTLDRARRGGPIPSIQIDRVPGDLVNVRDGNERKALFIKALLPIVLEVNERILAERDHLVRLHERHATSRSLSVIERMWLAEVADRYGTDPSNFVELLKRVDVVPPSMAIAQAGVESGWGTSYAARVGNALFGQIQPTGRHSVKVPWKPGPAMPQPFQSVADSVEAYFLNLNTHFAYADFRSERARLRASSTELDGYHLIGQLRRYSELGQGYINFVRIVIRENRLSDFDRVKLPPI